MSDYSMNIFGFKLPNDKTCPMKTIIISYEGRKQIKNQTNNFVKLMFTEDAEIHLNNEYH